jgi:exosortase H (IPTLxxWG-CTERM-specific)
LAGHKSKKQKPSPGTKSSGALRRLLKANWPLFRIYLFFGVTLLAIFTIIMVKPVYEHVVVPLNGFLAESSAAVIRLFGNTDIICDETSISVPGFGINIAEGCNGIYALAIVIAGIVAFPARWKPKSIGLILAIILIMVLNYIRILTLWYAGLAGSFLFDTMHLYVWDFIIIALGAAFWYFWYEKFVKKR